MRPQRWLSPRAGFTQERRDGSGRSGRRSHLCQASLPPTSWPELAATHPFLGPKVWPSHVPGEWIIHACWTSHGARPQQNRPARLSEPSLTALTPYAFTCAPCPPLGIHSPPTPIPWQCPGWNPVHHPAWNPAFSEPLLGLPVCPLSKPPHLYLGSGGDAVHTMGI